MNIIWHYTSWLHIDRIMNDQTLKVSKVEKDFGLNPAVWFSKNPIWEPTATKIIGKDGDAGILCSIKAQLETIGMIRIGIEQGNDLVSWAKYKYVGNIPLPLYERMEQVGIEKGGNPKDWFCSFRNVGVSK